MKKAVSFLVWLIVAILGAWAYATLALHRGEHLNSVFILMAAVCTYTIGYRFYSKWIATRVLVLDDRRSTPSVAHDDGKDYVKTNKWIVFGHHFAAISGPGPLVGPVLAAQFGYLPGTLWILIGAVLGGAVQDFVILFSSLRRDGKSIGQMIKEELNKPAGIIALVAVLAIIIILLAVLALVVVNALAESPWGVFTVGATIPIAMFMGCYMRFGRIGKVLEASAIGVILLLLAVWGGQFVHQHEAWAKIFTLNKESLAWTIIIYGFAASVLPVWLLLAPRDYLSTFMKLGTIFLLVAGCFLVLPDLKMPAITQFIDGSGLVVPGKLFPFCFITIACGAISGFHSLISSGTTPKLLTRESYARPVGYGAMCLESLVAIMAIIAACTLDPGVYMSVNFKAPGATAAEVATATVKKVNSLGSEYAVTVDEMDQLAKQIGEKTLFGRTGGAATLAVGMAHIFSHAVHGRWLDLWYHFAIMFEALFILTTLDAGTRVGRYLLQDALGAVWKPLGNTKKIGAGIFSSVLIVTAWGWFLIQGVRDPDGGVKALWPIFGIANQLLASIALCLATTVLIKMSLQRGKSPALAFVTLLPLAWLLTVTIDASMIKIWDPNPKIGFLAAAHLAESKLPAAEQALAQAIEAAPPGTDDAVRLSAIPVAKKAVKTIQLLRFNSFVDAWVTGFFLILVSAIVILSIYEWLRLLNRSKASTLSETEPVYLPASALSESSPLPAFGIAMLGFTLLKELSGEAAIDRAEVCACAQAEAAGQVSPVKYRRQNAFLTATADRYRGVNRCC